MVTAATTIQAWRCGRLCSSLSHPPLSSLSCRVLAPTRRSRPFFSLAAAALGQAQNADSAHTLTTERTLPYADRDLFRIIADVDAYDQFLPHCTLSRVTRWRLGDGGGGDGGARPSWPARADLTVGWGPLQQTYSSRVYCIPGRGVVEAVSGQHGSPSLTADERAELGLQQDNGRDREEAEEEIAEAARARARSPDDDPFESLATRWTVRSLNGGSAGRLDAGPPSWSHVELRIRFQFRNPLYQLAATQVGNEMAAKMIEAFESRARDILGPPSRSGL